MLSSLFSLDWDLTRAVVHTPKHNFVDKLCYSSVISTV